MTDAQKEWIDRASYYDLLLKWRFSPSGNPFFADDCGKYYAKVMEEKRAADPAGAVRASKDIGFRRQGG
jgi:hypothetical protein